MIPGARRIPLYRARRTHYLDVMPDPEILVRLTDDMKTAMKARNSAEVSACRMLIAALKNKRIALGHDLSGDEATQVLTSEAKKRRESIEAFAGAGRTELAEKERAELAIVERYLPKQLTEAEAQQIVDAVIEEVGAKTPKDMGRVMGQVMKKVAGRFDGKQVQALVRAKLGG